MSKIHGWFFGYIRTLAEYRPEYEKVIRESIVYYYSGGSTDSLREFFESDKRAYFRMKKELTCSRMNDADRARKRVIAVLFSWLNFNGYNPDINYVKKVACKAAGCRSFNEIPQKKLRQLYRIFGGKYKKVSDEWSDRLLDKIAGDVQTELKN